MDSKTDILILTARFGTGHMSASLGIREHIKGLYPTLKIKIVDVFNIIIPKLSSIMYKGYEVLVKKSPKLYNYFYKRDNEKQGSSSIIVDNKYILNKLYGYILRINPKLIISTFPIASQYISKLKKDYNLTTPLITCITDIVNGWEWISYGCDMYFVATEENKKNMINMAVDARKIVVTGIPIRKEFLKDEKPITKLSFPKENTILTVMGGGMGLLLEDKEFYQWINSISNVTVLVLTGNNNVLFETISNWNLKNIIPIKFTDKVASIMAQTDLLISKAGGITLFEAITKGLPMIIYKPELGQELENARFVKEKGIGEIASDIDNLKQIIESFRRDENKINKYRLNIKELKNIINMKVLVEESIRLISNY